MVPLHMAMVAATVANGGADDEALRRARRRSTTTATCSTRTEPEVWKTPITPETAATLRDLMSASPSAARRAAASPSTAASPWPPRPAPPSSTTRGEEERSNAWIVAFAPADAPLRRRRDAQGHQRRDLGRHRRPPGRPDRQGRARRRLRRRGRVMTAAPKCAGRPSPGRIGSLVGTSSAPWPRLRPATRQQ